MTFLEPLCHATYSKSYREDCSAGTWYRSNVVSKASSHRPSNTLFSGHRAPLPAHFSEPRSITTREAARLQGFPDDFRVYGSWQSDGIGNECCSVATRARAVLQVLPKSPALFAPPQMPTKSLAKKILDTRRTGKAVDTPLRTAQQVLARIPRVYIESLPQHSANWFQMPTMRMRQKSSFSRMPREIQ